MVQVIEGKVGTVYYCPLDKATYKITGDHRSVRVTDPANIAAGQNVRISNWRSFYLENDKSGRPAGASPPKVLIAIPTPPPVGAGTSNGPHGADNEPHNPSSSGAGRTPAHMPQLLWQYCVDAGRKTGVDPYVLAAQMERESSFGAGLNGPSAGDGLMQVESSTRNAYAGKFRQQIGHTYNHGDPKDQVLLAAVIMADKGGSIRTQLLRYNGGDNWHPGATDSYGRVIHADIYADAVLARARQMRAGG